MRQVAPTMPGMARPSPQTDRVVALIETLRAHPERPMTLAAVTRKGRRPNLVLERFLEALAETV